MRFETGQLQQQHHNAQMQALKLTQLAERANQRRSQIDTELAEIEQQAVAETVPEGGMRKQNWRNIESEIEVLREQEQKEKLASAERQNSF